MAPILTGWLDNHMFAASVLIGFTVMQRFPGMKVVLAHGKASWMEEVLEKMEASVRVIPLLHKYPVRTDVEEMWEEGRVMLGFDADERFIRKMPHDFADEGGLGLAAIRSTIPCRRMRRSPCWQTPRCRTTLWRA